MRTVAEKYIGHLFAGLFVSFCTTCASNIAKIDKKNQPENFPKEIVVEKDKKINLQLTTENSSVAIEGYCGNNDYFSGDRYSKGYTGSEKGDLENKSHLRYKEGLLIYTDHLTYMDGKKFHQKITNRQSGTYKEYLWNSVGLLIKRIVSNEDGTSMNEFWWDNGNIKRRFRETKEGLNGRETYWYEDGKVRCEIDYLNNLVHGTLVYWNKSGKITKQEKMCMGFPCSSEVQKRLSDERLDFSAMTRDEACNENAPSIKRDDELKRKSEERIRNMTPDARERLEEIKAGLLNDAPRINVTRLTCSDILKESEEEKQILNLWPAKEAE
jgi:antitoxin component YwqK of YwqJK toxin-antitoxin module